MGSLGKESYLNCAESMNLKSWVTFAALALNLLFYCFELCSLWKYLQDCIAFFLQEKLSMWKRV